jgi:hypothetical protein
MKKDDLGDLDDAALLAAAILWCAGVAIGCAVLIWSLRMLWLFFVETFR